MYLRLGFVLVVGCGSPPVGPDGGALDGAAIDGAALDSGAPMGVPTALPPAAPALPDFGECPAGWFAVTRSGVAECHAFTGEPPTCAEGEIARPGAPNCARLGPACPTDGFPPDPGGGDVRWVQAGASGDGSRAAPFGSISEALIAPGRATTIAIGSGIYDESLTLTPGTRLVGACVSGTILSNSSGSGVVVREGSVELSNLSILSPEGFGIHTVGMGSSLLMRAVRIEGARGLGILVTDGGSVTGEDVTIVGTRVRSDGTLGRGAQTQTGSQLILRRTMLANNLEYGVIASDARLELEDVLIRDVDPAPEDGVDGFGILIDGATVSLTRVTVDDVFETGIFATGTDTVLTAERLEISGVQRSTQSVASLIVRGGATATIDRARLDVVADRGVTALEMSQVRLTNTVITGPRDGQLHTLVRVRGDAMFEAERLVLRDAGFTAMSLASARATLTDVTIEAVEAVLFENPMITPITTGQAVQLDFGAELTVRRGAFVDLAGEAIFATDDSRLDLRDLRVSGVRRVGKLAHGIILYRGSAGSFERVVLDEIEGTAVFVSTGELDAMDLQITPSAGPGVVGFSQSFIARDARVRGDRWVFRGGIGFGLELWHSMATLGSLVIEDVGIRRCPAEGCLVESPDTFGMGLGVYAESAAEVAEIYVIGAAFCGVHLDEPSSLAVERGLITGNAIGVCAHGGNAQLAPVVDGVRFVDNELTVDSTSLALPEAPAIDAP